MGLGWRRRALAPAWLVGRIKIWSAETINDSGFVDVVGRHLKFDAIAGGEADEAFPHFARDMSENGVIVGELDAEHGARENGSDLPFEFDSFFRIHIFAKPALKFNERRLA